METKECPHCGEWYESDICGCPQSQIDQIRAELKLINENFGQLTIGALDNAIAKMAGCKPYFERQKEQIDKYFAN